MNPDTILQIISQWAPVVSAVAGIVGVVAVAVGKIKHATSDNEAATKRLEKKMDQVIVENLELKRQLNQKLLDEHKIYTRNHGKKD